MTGLSAEMTAAMTLVDTPGETPQGMGDMNQAAALAAQSMAANGPLLPQHGPPQGRTVTREQLRTERAEAKGTVPSTTEALEAKVNQLTEMMEKVLQTVKGQPPTLDEAVAKKMMDVRESLPEPLVPPTVPDGEVLETPEEPLEERYEEVEEGVDEKVAEDVARDRLRFQDFVDNVRSQLVLTGAKDPHRQFRYLLARTMGRTFGYSMWTQEMKMGFDTSFQGLLSNSLFVEEICRKLWSTANGKGMGSQKVSRFIAVTAGFLAFSGMPVG